VRREICVNWRSWLIGVKKGTADYAMLRFVEFHLGPVRLALIWSDGRF
jgi:hypothetical protein